MSLTLTVSMLFLVGCVAVVKTRPEVCTLDMLWPGPATPLNITW